MNAPKKRMVKDLVESTLGPLKDLTSNKILQNTASLYGTTIITSLLGFFYWFIAAKILSASSVGIAVAVQAASQLVALLCMIGLGTLTIGELAKGHSKARSLILTVSAAGGAFALIGAILAGLALETFSSSLRPGLEGPIRLVVFCLLCSLTTVTLIIDDSCIGLLRGDLQLKRNAIFAATKLLILPALVFTWDAHSGLQLLAAWLVGLILSLLIVIKFLGTATKGQSSHFDFADLFSKRRLITHHHWLNMSLIAPAYLWPIVVASVIGARETAAFNAAWFCVIFVNAIPAQFSTVLFSLPPGDEIALRREVRISMRICTILACVAAPFFAATSWFILGVFSRDYRVATGVMILLAFTVLPSAIKFHYVSILRVRGQIRAAAIRTSLTTVVDVALAVTGAKLYGLTGLGAGLLVASLAEMVLFAPLVLGVIRASAQEE